MSNQTLTRRKTPDAHLNEHHTAARGNSLERLMAIIPTDVVLTEITADCQVHGKQKWLASRRAIAAGETGCQKCQSDRDERKKKIIRQRDELLDSMNTPPVHKRASFNDWHLYGTDEVRARLVKIADFSKEYAKNYKVGSPSILLSGPTGTGKTKLACIIANEIVRQNFNPRMTVLFKRSSDIQNEFKETWSNNNDKTKAGYMRLLATVSVLIIDEVGEGDTGYSATSINKDRELLSAVIDRRYSKGLPTIITTNMTADEFYGHIGDRAKDRLRQNLISVPCVWRSYRDAYNNLQVV